MSRLILTKCRLILTLLFGLYKPPKTRLRYNRLQIGVQNVIWWLVSAVVKEMGKGEANLQVQRVHLPNLDGLSSSSRSLSTVLIKCDKF